jgi:1-pyrroline-4-hydroxy-2-carboxylate deaminase
MRAWHGIVVAAALPFTADLRVDFDQYQEHVKWLADNGARGVSPNGSLGEYQVLTESERADVVRAAVEAAPAGFSVVAGTGAYGTIEARRWAEQAQEAGADAILSLPPNAYVASDEEVIAHYRALAKVGIPVVAYNNPIDTKVDLTPELLAELSDIDEVVAVKEFSTDIRRVQRIRTLAPRIEVLAGADDEILESVLMGAVGWIGGFSNSLPQLCARIYQLAKAGEIGQARALYDLAHPAFGWDTKVTFVQAIKLSMDIVGRYGGPCRPPRLALPPQDQAQLRKDIELALSAKLPGQARDASGAEKAAAT